MAPTPTLSTYLKVLLSWALFTLEFEQPIPWRGKMRWCFYGLPRPVPMTIFIVLTCPLSIVAYGFSDWRQQVKKAYRPQRFSSMQLLLPVGTAPKKFEAYRKLL